MSETGTNSCVLFDGLGCRALERSKQVTSHSSACTWSVLRLTMSTSCRKVLLRSTWWPTLGKSRSSLTGHFMTQFYFLSSLLHSCEVRRMQFCTASSMFPMFTMSPSTGRLDGEIRKVKVKFNFEFWWNIHFEIPWESNRKPSFTKCLCVHTFPSTFQADEPILTKFP